MPMESTRTGSLQFSGHEVFGRLTFAVQLYLKLLAWIQGLPVFRPTPVLQEELRSGRPGPALPTPPISHPSPRVALCALLTRSSRERLGRRCKHSANKWPGHHLQHLLYLSKAAGVGRLATDPAKTRSE